MKIYSKKQKIEWLSLLEKKLLAIRKNQLWSVYRRQFQLPQLPCTCLRACTEKERTTVLILAVIEENFSIAFEKSIFNKCFKSSLITAPTISKTNWELKFSIHLVSWHSLWLIFITCFWLLPILLQSIPYAICIFTIFKN